MNAMARDLEWRPVMEWLAEREDYPPYFACHCESGTAPEPSVLGEFAKEVIRGAAYVERPRFPPSLFTAAAEFGLLSTSVNVLGLEPHGVDTLINQLGEVLKERSEKDDRTLWPYDYRALAAVRKTDDDMIHVGGELADGFVLSGRWNDPRWLFAKALPLADEECLVLYEPGGGYRLGVFPIAGSVVDLIRADLLGLNALILLDEEDVGGEMEVHEAVRGLPSQFRPHFRFCLDRVAHVLDSANVDQRNDIGIRWPEPYTVAMGARHVRGRLERLYAATG